MIAVRQVLKYVPPDMTMLENALPTKEMKGFFREHMEFDHMTDEVMTAWEMIAESYTD